MVEYKGYSILGKALKVYPDSPYWYSEGDVFTHEPGGSILIKRLRGALVESQQAAEAHGLKLCRQWIDQIEKASEM
jgi:hypothetical protein